MILTRDGKEITAVYRQDGSEVDEVKDANGRLVYTNTREITGTLPLPFSGRGKPLTDYLISGNAVQDGTPSSQAPVDVVGCGVWDETQQSYKLPLTVNGTEYPIYLGEVESTRRIKKMVLTGEENWNRAGSSHGYFTNLPSTAKLVGASGIISSHYQSSMSGADGTIRVAQGSIEVLIYDNYTSVAEFKAYLAAQYAAGTPVTVWYVLAEPEIGIVNEPLMKIGNYADTISFAQAGVTIPTVSGANVLDMTSPVKPSEVYIKGNGIKAIT